MRTVFDVTHATPSQSVRLGPGQEVVDFAGVSIEPPPVSETRRRLTLYPPTTAFIGDQMDVVRGAIIAIGELLEQRCRPGRELSLALTKLEECSYWAIAAIARHQDEYAASPPPTVEVSS